MPLYEYHSKYPEDPKKSCSICAKGFELRRPVDRPVLEFCPLCKNPVQKKVSQVNVPRILKPVSLSDAKKAGFTVMEKREDGVYEKR